MFVKVFDFVLADGSITFDGQSRQESPGGGEFHAKTIRLVDVGGEFFAYVAQFTSLHELVLVVHPVEIRAGSPSLAHKVVAHFGVE